MNINPDIFKAYDVRGVYPGEVNEDAARAIGGAFVAYPRSRPFFLPLGFDRYTHV